MTDTNLIKKLLGEMSENSEKLKVVLNQFSTYVEGESKETTSSILGLLKLHKVKTNNAKKPLLVLIL